MITTESSVVGLYVAKTCPEHWIAWTTRADSGWSRLAENPWERRQPFQWTEDTELEPIPGHYKYVLGLPV